MTTARAFLLPTVFAAALLAAAQACDCGGGGRCTLDAQCDATGQGFSKCNLDTGFCICSDDRACGPNEFCNGAGRCQAESGCVTNDDCGDGGGGNGGGLFCDVTSSQCLSVAECNPQNGETCCTLDDQCPFNQICDVVSRKCVPGCRDDGDCVLGQGCIGAAFGRLGQCGLSCTSDALCPPQYLCNLDSLECELDNRGPYCQGCNGGAGDDVCGAGHFDNYCLIDEFEPGANFCGVDCHDEETCPNGYSCQDVIIIPPQAPECHALEACSAAGTCTITGASCTADEDCPEGPPGGDCPAQVGHKGSCTGANQNIDCTTDADCPEGECNLVQCTGSEGAERAFCTCTRDSDCPADSCTDADVSDPAHPVAGHCQLSGHQCFGTEECDVITCVNGGCLIGKNCAPANDQSCADIKRKQDELTGGGATSTGASP